MPDSTVVAGPPVRADSAISCTGRVSVDVKYSVMRLTTWASTRPIDDGAEHPPADVGLIDSPSGCRRRRGRRAPSADHGEDAGGEEAAVDRRHRRLVLVGRPHREHADDRGEHADGAGGQREDEPEAHSWRREDRWKAGDAEDDRRDERDLVRLEQVGGHAGAVADVVADVVGDGRRVAGVVLGDAGLDLADEVGADVGRLGEDAAADPQEQRRAASRRSRSRRGSPSWCSGRS